MRRSIRGLYREANWSGSWTRPGKPLFQGAASSSGILTLVRPSSRPSMDTINEFCKT